MRAGLWLYLDLLARLPVGADTFEVEPAAIGRDMGLPEGTVRSWLGHLRKAGYLDAVRLNGKVKVTIKRPEGPEPPPAAVVPTRFFTVAKIQRALGEPGNEEALQAALSLYPDSVVQGTPDEQLSGGHLHSITMQPQTILGIDPGTKEMGFAVLRDRDLLAYGVHTLRNGERPFYPSDRPVRLSAWHHAQNTGCTCSMRSR